MQWETIPLELRNATAPTKFSLAIRAGDKFKPPVDIPTLDWLRDEFVLPPESGDLAGSYNPDYVPYLWGIFAALDDPKIKLIAMMKAAQIGWTFGLVGFLGKRIQRLPGTIMMLFPKEGDAKAFSEEKLSPSIRSTPALSGLIDTRTRVNGNTAFQKRFPGGFIKMVGSNSTGNVKSTPAQLVIAEEPDDTSDNIASQGDALRLVRERLKRQSSGKMILGGTPSVKGASRVEEFVEMSNQMVLPITCQDCEEQHVLDWANVSWIDRTDNVEHVVFGKADPDTAVYSCPNCGSIWDDWQRKKNVFDTIKKAYDDGEKFCGWQATAQTSGGIVGFKELNELYVCIPGTSLADVARDYLEALHEQDKGDQSGMIVFENSKLGRPYEFKTDAPEADDLAERAEDYKVLTVPHGGLVLTAGVDVQHDRLAITIWAHGRDEEMWLVYWDEIPAKVTCIDIKDPVWEALDDLLFQSFKHQAGFEMKMSAISVDSSDGATSDAVYTYVRKRQKRGVMAVKGSSNDYGTREIYMLPKKIDHKSATKSSKYGLRIYMVGTYKAKELLIGGKGRVTLKGRGAGRMHWPKDIRADFYEQLMSEVLAPHRTMKRKFQWHVKSGVRNEAVDCTVMALHAARSVKVHTMTERQWQALEDRYRQADIFAAPINETQQEQDIQQPAAKKAVGSWVGSDEGEWF